MSLERGKHLCDTQHYQFITQTEPSMWTQEPSVDQASSGHHSDDDYNHKEESLHPENCVTEPRDR